MGRAGRYAHRQRRVTPPAIRLARLAEAALLPAIEHSSDQLFRGGELDHIARALPPAASTYWPHVQAGAVWVAANGGDIPVAFLAAETQADGAVIHQLSVARDHQRQGLGSALMAAAIAWAGETGQPRVMLTTFRQVPWNEPYYRRLGFVEPPADRRPATLSRLLDREAVLGHDPARRCGMVLEL